METTIRKFDHSLGIILPETLNAKIGDRYQITNNGDSLILTPLRNQLFSNENDWTGFRDSISKADTDWDRD
ncbi:MULTISPECIES: antitoxin MazE [Levilactobacillus]|uniref:AbrB/MazE/SpoVT family DNA-binding domain-containing protein n=1 Tax=Levilactobacillus TaxID=2767886 RepID=UPI001950AA5A|nr:antitoxin MazE [Levilactobacillus sp. 244-2]